MTTADWIKTTADWIKRRRELLDAATPGPWEPGETQRYHGGRYHVSYSEVEPSVAAGCDPADAALIADARTSLPLALDALEAVLARHRPVSYVATANCGLVLYEVRPTCHDKAGVHPCGCWRDEDQIHVCADCNRVWPCPTVDAIDTAPRAGS